MQPPEKMRFVNPVAAAFNHNFARQQPPILSSPSPYHHTQDYSTSQRGGHGYSGGSYRQESSAPYRTHTVSSHGDSRGSTSGSFDDRHRPSYRSDYRSAHDSERNYCEQSRGSSDGRGKYDSRGRTDTRGYSGGQDSRGHQAPYRSAAVPSSAPYVSAPGNRYSSAPGKPYASTPTDSYASRQPYAASYAQLPKGEARHAPRQVPPPNPYTNKLPPNPYAK